MKIITQDNKQFVETIPAILQPVEDYIKLLQNQIDGIQTQIDSLKQAGVLVDEIQLAITDKKAKIVKV